MYMIVTNSHTAGDNQLRDSTITPQKEVGGTYYNKNIFTRVLNIVNGQACKIKCRYYLVLQVFLSTAKPTIQYNYKKQMYCQLNKPGYATGCVHYLHYNN